MSFSLLAETHLGSFGVAKTAAHLTSEALQDLGGRPLSILCITFPPPIHNSFTGSWHAWVRNKKSGNRSEEG